MNWFKSVENRYRINNAEVLLTCSISKSRVRALCRASDVLPPFLNKITLSQKFLMFFLNSKLQAPRWLVKWLVNVNIFHWMYIFFCNIATNFESSIQVVAGVKCLSIACMLDISLEILSSDKFRTFQAQQYFKPILVSVPREKSGWNYGISNEQMCKLPLFYANLSNNNFRLSPNERHSRVERTIFSFVPLY